MDEQEIRSRVSAMMPEILADLERLVAIPSVAFPGFPPEPVHEMAAETLEMFKGVGFSNASLQEVPTGYPPVYGEIPGPGRLARRDAVRPLRRPAGAAGAGVDHGPMGADAQGRPDLRPGCRRRQGGPRDPYRDAQGLRRASPRAR